MDADERYLKKLRSQAARAQGGSGHSSDSPTDAERIEEIRRWEGATAAYLEKSQATHALAAQQRRREANAARATRSANSAGHPFNEDALGAVEARFAQRSPIEQSVTQAPAGYQPGYYVRSIPQTNTLAILSLIFSIVGVSLVGVIFGHIAVRQIDVAGQDGRGLALGGLVIGYIGIVASVIWLIVLLVQLGQVEQFAG
jgi:Domain of unknown function (DUF4190)